MQAKTDVVYPLQNSQIFERILQDSLFGGSKDVPNVCRVSGLC